MLSNNLSHFLGAALLLCIAPACSSSSSADPMPVAAPTVSSSSPDDNAVGVPINAGIVANFSEPMNEASLDGTTFTLTAGASAIPVVGTVIYSDSTAVFWPAVHLTAGATYTATVTTEAESSSTGMGLAANHVWSFDTGNTMEPGVPVRLGTASNFAILSKAGISTVPASSIVGDIGVSPAAATAITQFSLVLDASGVFSTSTQVTGNVYAADYTPPTPQNLTTAVDDMERAFTDAAGRAPDVTEAFAGSINIPETLAPGVYKWGTGLAINADVTLSGSATDVWIFQIAGDLVVSSSTAIGFAGAARPENVFWQVSGLVDLGTTSTLNGVVLTATAVTVSTGATVNGRLLAQTAVTLDQSTVVEPLP
jgi:hypothetical protein